jgi:hypothetical protein
MRWKPLALALALVPVVAAPASAQLGFKAGLTFATLSEDDASPDFKNQTGFAAGVAIGLPLGIPILRLQPELLYVEKGAKVEPDTEVKIAYLEVPVLFRVNIPSPGITPFAVAGPMASLRLSCEIDAEDCDQDVESVDYGVALGAGLRFGGPLGLTLEGRYTAGLKNINKVSEGIDNKTRTFMVLAGVSF